MSKKIISTFAIIIILNITLTLWSLYNERKNQARTCLAIYAIHDSVMTKLNGAVYDEQTAGIFNQCVGNSFFLVPGF